MKLLSAISLLFVLFSCHVGRKAQKNVVRNRLRTDSSATSDSLRRFLFLKEMVSISDTLIGIPQRKVQQNFTAGSLASHYDGNGRKVPHTYYTRGKNAELTTVVDTNGNILVTASCDSLSVLMRNRELRIAMLTDSLQHSSQLLRYVHDTVSVERQITVTKTGFMANIWQIIAAGLLLYIVYLKVFTK